jgi:hypothetical protein
MNWPCATSGSSFKNPTDMHSRFEYVWQHFQSLYRVPAGFQVAYGAAASGKVRIEAYQGDFFEKQDPWPEEISWQEWEGQPLPFLFSRHAPSPLMSADAETITIHCDIIAAAFYFLSGWQEYHSSDRDQFGRFPYQKSLQYKLGIITRPVVNYYFDILKTAIEQAARVKLVPRFNPDAGFTVCLTHDIDNTESAWKAEGRVALQKGRLLDFFKLLVARLKGRDAWFNWTDIARQIHQAGGISTFFFLCQNKPYRGTRNADYTIEKEKYQSAITSLKSGGNEIAVHGSLEAALNPALFLLEKARLPGFIRGNRFHYLRFDPQRTPGLLDTAGMDYDSTLGFAEHFGFRHGYCFPFRLFNFRENKPYHFLEIPLILMDVTLDHPNYLQLKAKEVLPAITPVLAEIRKFQGCFTLLWHNENFRAYKKHNGGQVLAQILEELSRHQVTFMTGAGIQEQFAPWLPPA